MDMDTNAIGLVRYSKNFEKIFVQEQLRLGNVLEGAEILHVGSTAAGISAKPVVDIMVAVAKIEDSRIKKLETLEYEFMGDTQINGAQASKFFILANGIYSVYLHLVKRNTKFYNSVKQFKKILLENKDIRKAYVQLKQGLEKLSGGGSAYGFRKSIFINFVMENAADIKAIKDKKEVLLNHTYIVKLLSELGLYNGPEAEKSYHGKDGQSQ